MFFGSNFGPFCLIQNLKIILYTLFIRQILMDHVVKGRVTTIPFVLKVEIWPFVSALNVARNMSLCAVAMESPTITNVSSNAKPVSRKQTLPSSKTHLAVSQFRLLKFKRVSKWAP